MSCIFGISIGNENMTMSAYQGGEPVVIVNAHGSRNTPAYVAFSEGEVVVGDIAKSISVKRPKEVVHSLPFLLANANDVSKVRQKKLGFDLDLDDSGEQIIGVMTTIAGSEDSSTHTLTECFAELLKAAKTEVESFLGNAVTDVIVTLSTDICPDAKAVGIVAMAAEQAGLNVKRVVRNSTSALLPSQELKSTSTVVVVDCGGLTSECAAIKFNSENSTYSLISNNSAEVGSRDYDDVLCKYFSTEFHKKTRIDLIDDRRGRRKLLAASEIAKKALSTRQQATVEIEALSEGVDFNGNVTQSRFSAMASDVTSKITDMVKKCISDLESFEHFMLIGGGVQTAQLRDNLNTILSKSGATNLSVRETSEQSSLGTAIQSSHCQESGLGVPVGNSFWKGTGKAKLKEKDHSWGSEHDPSGIGSKVRVTDKALGIVCPNGNFKSLLPAGSIPPAVAKISLPVEPTEDGVVIEFAEEGAGIPFATLDLKPVTGTSVNISITANVSGVAVSANDGKGNKASAELNY
eukprot:TRINITY_DN2957_c4_g1_i1.p1 TRINITY_DN2957_c4_g1~~TRINITY_DN2957_c4_g1_i1.p1  ORF type:complete len:520 (+),score=135.86 TRINITY_DN2957_c4_g1_i1:44-1603(+)